MNTRFYLTASGHIVDSNEERFVARMKDAPGWNDFGRAIVATLNDGAAEATVLRDWADRLEPAE